MNMKGYLGLKQKNTIRYWR